MLHTPGHAPGAVCLSVPSLGCVFTGDTLFEGGPGATGRSYSDADLIKDVDPGPALRAPRRHRRAHRPRPRHHDRCRAREPGAPDRRVGLSAGRHGGRVGVSADLMTAPVGVSAGRWPLDDPADTPTRRRLDLQTRRLDPILACRRADSAPRAVRGRRPAAPRRRARGRARQPGGRVGGRQGEHLDDVLAVGRVERRADALDRDHVVAPRGDRVREVRAVRRRGGRRGDVPAEEHGLPVGAYPASSRSSRRTRSATVSPGSRVPPGRKRHSSTERQTTTSPADVTATTWARATSSTGGSSVVNVRLTCGAYLTDVSADSRARASGITTRCGDRAGAPATRRPASRACPGSCRRGCPRRPCRARCRGG